jgi:ATP-dependent RNA helicase DeaD
MTTDFMDFGLHQQLLQAVIELGYLEATPIQAAVIPMMMNGQDVIGRAQTGTGKTAAFALPILQNLQPGRSAPQALVLAPTRELALQVCEVTAGYGQYRGARVLAVYGGASYGPQLGGLRRGVDIVVGTPGRLIDLLDRGALDLSNVRTVVLDEADEMLSMGFHEDIQKMLKALPAQHQTALFSATISREIQQLAEQYMNNPETVSIEPEHLTVAAIDQRYAVVKQSDKIAALARLFEVEPITSALVFARTKVGSGELAAELVALGYPVEVLNGDLSQEVRERVVNRFRQNQVKILVATDVAARGLDIDNISHVFNYDLPDDAEYYVHRIGRTGRAGKTGIAITFVTPSEQWRLRRIENFIRQPLTRVRIPSVDEIVQRREAMFLERIQACFSANIHPERKMVKQMMDEGVDVMDLAAAALKLARGEDIQRPIPAMSEIAERNTAGRDRSIFERSNDRGQSGDNKRSGNQDPYGDRGRPARRPRVGRDEPRPGQTVSHEDGMVRLALSMGKAHGIRPADIVGTIAFHADIPGKVIGRIHIQDQETFVDVPEHLVEQVLAKRGKYKIRRQNLAVERA